MNEFKQLDIELLTGYQANLSPAILAQMAALYREQSLNYLERINQALDAEQQQWQQCCHKMKGAAGSVGFVEVHALLVSMEKTMTKWDEKSAAITQLQHLNELALQELQQWLAS